MWFLVLGLLLVVAVFVLSIYTPVHRLEFYLSVPLILSIYTLLSIVALVPADIVEGGLGIVERTRLILWHVIYWYSFCLTWAVLPCLQYYLESGYHDPIRKIKDAISANIRHQLLLAAIGLVGLLYMGASTGSLTNLKALAVALSYSYSLVLCIWLLGHGLVSAPRDLWRSLPGPQLGILYGRAQYVCDNYSEALGNYHDAAARVIALVPIKTSQYGEWIDDLVESVRASELGYPTSLRQSIDPRELNETFLAALSQRVARERARATRYRADWIKLLEDSAFYEDIQAAGDAGPIFRHHQTRLPAWYFTRVRPWLVRGSAALLTAASLVVAQSEIFMSTRFSLVDIAINAGGGALQVLITMAILGYMCSVTGHALTHVRVFNIYGLVPRHTDHSSLIFYSMYASRLAVPLSYNFLALASTHNTSVFQEFLGKYINLTPLGKYFSAILPRLTLGFMAMSYFDVYRTVQDYLGFLGEDEDSYGDGQSLVERALRDPQFEWSLDQVR